jgi:signal transduction histidine kinase
MLTLKHSDTDSAFVSVLKELIIVIVFNTVIAGFVTFLGVGDLATSLYFSQSIGLSIFLLSRLICFHRATTKTDWKTAVIAVPLGASVGTLIGGLANGIAPIDLLLGKPGFVLAILTITMVFGTVISYYFYSRSLLAETTAELQRQRSERLADEQHLTEARLKVLQAQIEPHFLFNTLSNILSLMRTDAATAEHMLENLTSYLRASFRSTRRDEIPLQDELALVGNYLAIQALRMVDRLSYVIDVADEFRQWPVPPFVLQPLVENAVKHGIEPEADGGQVTVSARRVPAGLQLEVSDTGQGISANSGPGIGLANVRERLQAKYGASATLLAQSMAPRGFKVTVVLPAGGAQ